MVKRARLSSSCLFWQQEESGLSSSKQRLLQKWQSPCWGPVCPDHCESACSYTSRVLFSKDSLYNCSVGAAGRSCWVLWPLRLVCEFHPWCFVWKANSLKPLFCKSGGLQMCSGLGGRGWRTLVCMRGFSLDFYYWSLLHQDFSEWGHAISFPRLPS